MERNFEKELAELKNQVQAMGASALLSLEKAISALMSKDASSVEKVFENEKILNQEELRMEDHIVQFAALHQPVAIDLRFLLVCLKITNDLERIGDHSVNIAESVKTLNAQDSPIAEELYEISLYTKAMVKDALAAFHDKDTVLASEVRKRDDLVDDLNRKVTTLSIQGVNTGSLAMKDAVEWIRISKNFERIADLSTNIAEETIYYVNAKVVKHSKSAHSIF